MLDEIQMAGWSGLNWGQYGLALFLENVSYNNIQSR